MWASNPCEQINDREGHRDQDAVQDSQGEDAEGAADGQEQFAPAEGCQPTELAHLDQAYGGVDDDGAEGGGGGVGEQRAEEEEDGGHAGGADEGVHLGTGSRGVREGGAAGTAADREAVQDSGAEVRRAEGQQLAVGVQGVWVVVPGEGACGQDDVGVADQ